ncbi:MAG TPA: cache domain-containing protein [Methanolinea sp.]|nr:cache domain-containing protein [Methanolinea sp.]HQK55656.1 cache domain-containing protein [Methanolinea sp.]
MRHGLSSILVILAALALAAGCIQTSPPAGTSTPLPTHTTAEHIVSSNTTASTGHHYPATSLEIKEYVDNAASWAKEVGKEAAIAAFHNASGPFVNGDVYVYALDYSGIALALPFQPGMVGTDFRPLKDAAGKPYTETEIQLAKGGGGYILYHYPYPSGEQQSTLKISYVRAVEDTYWVGAGVYTREDLLIDNELRQFVAEARAYALEQGRDRATAAFNNQSGPFIRGDLYIFAYDYNGTVLCWPYQPEQVGVNRLNATDPVGNHHVKEFIDVAKSGGGLVDYYSVNPFTNRTDLKISYVTDVDGTWMLGAGRYVELGQFILRA